MISCVLGTMEANMHTCMSMYLLLLNLYKVSGYAYILILL